MSESEPTNDVKSETMPVIAENTIQLNIPCLKYSELSVKSTHSLKKSTSIKLNRKTGGIFGNQMKNVRSVSNLNQIPVLQNHKRRPRTVSTIPDQKISSRQNSEQKLLKTSLSKCNSVSSLCSTVGGTLHKPGFIPSYLKGDSKSSVESEFFAKLRKFKLEKRKLNEQQVTFKKDYNELKRLQQKLISMGGKELKLDEINFIDLYEDGVGIEAKFPLKCEATTIELAKKNIDLSLMDDIEVQIKQIREGDLVLRNKFLRASADIFENLNRIQDDDVKQNCLQSFKCLEDYNEGFKDVENATKELLSQNLVRLKKDFIDAATDSSVSKALNEQRSKILEYQIDNAQLKKQIDDLGRKLKLSEQQCKAQESVKRELEANKESALKQIEEQNGEIEKFKSRCKNLKIAEDKLRKEVENLRSDVTSYESEIGKLRGEVNRLQNQLFKSEQTCTDVSDKLRLYESKCINLEKQLEKVSNVTMSENDRLCKQIEQLQCNLNQREVKVTSLQHLFRLQDTENVNQEFNDAMDGIRKLRGGNCDSYKCEFLKEELELRAMKFTDQKDTFASLQKLLGIRDNLLASMRHEQGH